NLRQGHYFPPFLEPRKTAEMALVTVIQEAWIGRVSTRRVDELGQADRDIAAGWQYLETACGLCRSGRHARTQPRGKPEFLTLDSCSERETDSPLEESGFEPVWGSSCQVVFFGS